MHLEVEVEKARLEVEVVTSGMVKLWRPCVLCSSCEKGSSSRGRKAFRGLKNLWYGLCDYLKDQGLLDARRSSRKRDTFRG